MHAPELRSFSEMMGVGVGGGGVVRGRYSGRTTFPQVGDEINSLGCHVEIEVHDQERTV